MSGHSKWSTIKRQKEAQDKKRGQLFSKLAKAITIAARSGADPESNFKLRLVVEKAKAANMPKENIERAIAKGSGEGEGVKLEEVFYEGYGPQGVALMVEAVTDNRNRTTAEIKNIFERGGGHLAEPGAVAYQFRKSGLIAVKKKTDPEAQILAIIDLGVEDIEEVEDAIEVHVALGQLEVVKQKLEASGFKVISAEIVRQPKVLLKIVDEQKATRVLKLTESLQEHDDVQQVFANFDIPASLIGR